MSEKRFTLLAGGLLIGALAGAVAGLLTAPKSGRETRRQLAAKAKDTTGRLQEEMDRARGRAKRSYDRLLARLRDLEAKAERKAKQIRGGSGAPA
jgi:gas vesicle protein